MVVGILGILRAGGAYVPLDPNYPAERLRFMRTDAGAGVVLTTRELAARHDVGDVRVEYLDDAETDEPLSEPAANDEDSLAYIIYTSGSTGTPKGVEVTHANLAHSTIARDVVYGKPPQRFLLLSSFSFDSSVAGIFWTLSGGGALVLPDEGSEADVTALADLIERHQVTHTLGLPSLYQVLLEHGAARLGSLRTVIVAGEACRPELVAAHQAALPRASLYNEYGPTEGTVWSTVFDCGEYVGGPVPIGRPLPNTPAYVLDERRRLLPMGAVGELCIGGPGVARGYRNHPDVTAARFVPDTIGSLPGARLYRTGDRVRYRPDGTLEFLGRVDHQVKVRGHRIELEEIESRLAAAPGVRETAVVAREDTPGDQRLVAYVAPGVDAPAADALIATLRTQLPEHMIPSAIVALDRLPKTATGKVDRAALPPPDQFSVSREAMVEPRTALERVLAGLWADVLGLEVVGVHDDFFKLGGHSLLVTRLVARARELLRLDVPLRAVFEQPTVAGFGEFLRAKSPVADDLERTAEVLLQVAQLSDDGVTAALSEGDAGR
jgi:amino acid adenylation domain-containing protein